MIQLLGWLLSVWCRNSSFLFYNYMGKKAIEIGFIFIYLFYNRWNCRIAMHWPSSLNSSLMFISALSFGPMSFLQMTHQASMKDPLWREKLNFDEWKNSGECSIPLLINPTSMTTTTTTTTSAAPPTNNASEQNIRTRRPGEMRLLPVRFLCTNYLEIIFKISIL